MDKPRYMVCAALFCLAALCSLPENLAAQAPSELRWYKGNTHTHTINSDGDSTPADVVKWYRENGYNFLFITDHEFITPVEGLNAVFSKAGSFIVIRGQEVTGSFDKKPYHVNGLGVESVSLPQKGESAVEIIQKHINMIRAAKGVPQINHPNFGWALTAAQITQLKNVNLMEIYNGHPLVNNLGGGDSPGVEEIWDQVLTAGRTIFGIADDDVHHIKRIGDRTAATPGHGWIVVRAAELTPAAILASIERGDFYASTGVELSDYQAGDRTITITINQERWSRYRIQFIGSGGRILKEERSSPAVYMIQGNEGYVRAKIIESNGKMAWTQPVRVAPR